MSGDLTIRGAVAADVPLILQLIRALAEYEKLAHEVIATEDTLRRTLFGAQPAAEVRIAQWQGQPAGFALFCPSRMNTVSKQHPVG